MLVEKFLGVAAGLEQGEAFRPQENTAMICIIIEEQPEIGFTIPLAVKVEDLLEVFIIKHGTRIRVLPLHPSAR